MTSAHATRLQLKSAIPLEPLEDEDPEHTIEKYSTKHSRPPVNSSLPVAQPGGTSSLTQHERRMIGEPGAVTAAPEGSVTSFPSMADPDETIGRV